MKTNIRNSAKKHRKMTGFRRRMSTADGRKILNNQRRKKKNLCPA
jgi:ribosomal protein L34